MMATGNDDNFSREKDINCPHSDEFSIEVL